MRRFAFTICFSLVFAAPAAAEWGQPLEPENPGVAPWPLRAATDDTGAGVLAWMGPEYEFMSTAHEYVVAAVRRPDGAIGSVQQLHPDATLIDVAVGGAGRRAVLLRAERPQTESLLAVSDGGAFAVERVPLPENEGAFGETVEVHDDGSITVLWMQSAAEMDRHLYAIRRAPDGLWDQAQQITQEKQGLTSFTSLIDSSGTTWAFWTNSVDPSDPMRWAVFAIHARPGEPFSAPAQLGATHRGMRVGEPLPALANSRGDVALLSQEELLLKAARSDSFISARAPAGYGGPMLPRSDLALDEAGNIYVAWRAIDVLGAYRPAGGPFRTTEVLARNTGTQTPPAIAFDGSGNLVYADNSDDGLIAEVRPPDGSFSDPRLIASRGVWAYELRRPVLAREGTLVLPWVTGAEPTASGEDTTPHLARLSTWTPLADQPTPVVSKLRAAGRAAPVTSAARRERSRRAAFRFKLSERARASLVFERKMTGKLFAGACYAPWTDVSGPPCETWIPFAMPLKRKGKKGRNRVELTRAQTKALAKLPEVRLVVAATDRGRKRSRERRLTFRVR